MNKKTRNARKKHKKNVERMKAKRRKELQNRKTTSPAPAQTAE